MKSPWKFLAQLLPQRQPAKKPETERSGSETPDASSLMLTETSSVAEHGESGVTTAAFIHRDPAADASQAVAEQVDIEAVEGLARRSRSRSRVDHGTLEVDGGTTKRHAGPSRQRRPAPGKSSRADVVQRNLVTNKDQPARASSRKSFFDEVAGVDEEIRQLRVRLTQKLHLQNDQLKKMLERFDRS
jgi:hypothetical protein